MIKKGLIVDTETGGLDPRVNPLVSISLIVFQVDPSKILDNFHIKIMPPDGTLMQIPVDPTDQSFNPKVAHLIDVNGQSYKCDERGNPEHPDLALRPIITCGAARVNGFTWQDWKDKSLPIAQADESFRSFLNNWFDHPPIAYAHNADFDEKFVMYTFPHTHAAIARPWLCTMRLYQKYLKATQRKASAKLAELAKVANADPETPAYLTLRGNGEDIISKAHDAGADTKMCFAAIQWLAAKMGPHNVFPSGQTAPDEHPEP